ncbi:MAG: ABC transporter ATP-binding protein [Thermostichales cyanobacterium HHBFW_bins_127]
MSRSWPVLALLPFIRPQLSTLGVALLCTVGFVSTMPVLAYFAERIAEVMGAGDWRGMGLLVGAGLILFVVRGVFQYGQDALMARATLRIVFELRQALYQHLQRLDLGYFLSQRTGDLTYRLVGDLDKLGEAIQKFFNQFIPSVAVVVVIIIYLFYLNIVLTLTTLIVAPLMGLLFSWFGEKMLSRARISQEQISQLSALLTEVLGGMILIKAFAAEDYEVGRFRRIADQNRLARYRTEHVKAVQYPVVGLLYALSVLAVFWVGTYQIAQGHLTGAQFVGFFAGVALLIDPIVLITNNYSELKQAQASLDRILGLFAIQPQVTEHPYAQILPPVQGKITFEQVYFAYQPGQPVLKGIDLTISPGEIVALVGSSGAGKSTLVSLIPRFYDPSQGRILIDGYDIRQVTIRSLRRQIGIVLQETILFSGTIAENIAYGQEGFDLAAVEQAAKVANAHDFICRFPDGYQTRLGERGVNLSGGQKQRLAIARAVLLNPRILILDEATSALDSESEALVQEALQRLMQQCTVLVIAHRLSTVENAHRIVVLEKGEIIEIGSHSQLLAQGGRYAQFHARQFSDIS